MYLAYFDENKYSVADPFFRIGGFLVPESKVIDLEKVLTKIQFNFFGNSTLIKETEFHGKDMLHGKGNFRGRKLSDRIQLFRDLTRVTVDFELSIRLVVIDVHAHRNKYAYPDPEYSLGLMLILERFCDYLDEKNELGIAFGDYEKDELTRSIVDFSQYKIDGRTPMYFGRPLGRLVDSVYFTHSHHSRFLQLADVVVYLAGRYEGRDKDPTSWHDEKAMECWKKIKANVDLSTQRWP